MSRLYAVMATAADLARHFGAETADDQAVPAENIEGAPGLVVIERDGRRHLRSFSWGFPRRARGSDEAGRIGLVADLTNALWETTVVDPRFRCLIPLTHFANPDGREGKKTRTWFSLADQPIAAWAGFCRNAPDIGPVYAGMTMEANEAIPPTNDRMPALLAPHEYEQWLHGSIEDVIRFQFRPAVAAERMMVERTPERWRSGGLPTAAMTGERLL
jgi:putative SOS response-associated peptidase YedK